MLALGAVAAALVLIVHPAAGPTRAAAPRDAAAAKAAALASATVTPVAARAATVHPVQQLRTPTFRVELRRRAVHVRSGRTGVSLTTLDGGAQTAWQRHAGRAVRSTSFGREVVEVTPAKAELYLLVSHRQHERLWRWRLGRRAAVAADGSVALARTPLRIDPVRVFDTAGRDITPAGLHWDVVPARVGSILTLRLEDAHLPLPYVIDPSVSSPYAAAVAADAPAGWWRLDDTGTTALDASGHSLSGTYADSVAHGATALVDDVDAATQFTGGRVDLPNSALLRTPTFSIEAWFKTSFGGTEQSIYRYIYFGEKLGIDPTGHVFGYIYDNATVNKHFVTSPLTYNDGARHHAVFTFDGTTMRLYVDGALVNSVTPAPGDLGTCPCYDPTYPGPAIGDEGFAIAGGVTLPFQGTLDEVAFYGGALDPSRVQAHYVKGVDGTPPTVSATASPGGDTNSAGPATVTFTAADNAGVYPPSGLASTTYERRTGTLAAGACSYAGGFSAITPSGAGVYTEPALADATCYQYRVTAVDNSGNANSATTEIRVDRTAPTATVTSPAPAGLNNDTSETFTFTASEASTFECSLDNGTTFAACGSASPSTSGSVTYANLADGVHNFVVRATDIAGNTGTSTVVTWTTDRTAPAASIMSGPADPTNATSATFSFTGSDLHGPVTFTCSLSGPVSSGAAGCTTGKTYAGLTAGTYTFTLVAKDAANNTTTVTRTWTIDLTPPVFTGAINGPANPSNVQTPSFTFSTNEPSTYTCSLAGPTPSAAAPCSSGVSFGPLADGSYTLTVTPTDLAGNQGASQSFSWTVDRTPPALSITSGPANGSVTTSRTATFTLSVEAGATTVCALDGVTVACGVPYSGLAQGAHTFLVTATDAADNVTQLPLRTWAVDLTPPTATLVSPTSGNVLSGPISFDVSAADNIGVMSVAVLEGGATRATLTPPSAAPASGIWTGKWTAPIGTHTLSIVVTDLAGLTFSVPLTITVAPVAPAASLDVTPPSAPQGFTGQIQSTGLVLYWDPARDNVGIADYGFWVNGRWVRNYGSTEFQADVGPFGSDDTRTFQLNAIDAAGNVGPFAPALTGVPSVVGRSQADATAALLARGFRVGAVTEEASPQEPGTVLRQTPASPGVAAVGSAVDLVVSRQGGQAKLVMAISVAHRVLLSQRNFVAVRVELSLPSTVTARLVSSRGRTVAAWRKSLKAGATIVRLTLPRSVARGGRYTLRISAVAGGQSVARSLPVTLVGKTVVRVKPVTSSGRRLNVALVNGPDIRRDIGVNLKSSVSLLYVAGSRVFGVAPNVGAAVVDVDATGVALIRQLRIVFPELRIVAVADTPADAALAKAAGASIVLVKPVSPTVIAAGIAALLGAS